MIRLLPDTDLARIAPLPDDLKRSSLRQLKGGWSSFSYKPVKALYADIFNIQPALFGAASRTPWVNIRAELLKRCCTADEFLYNERVARSLFAFSASREILGRQHDFYPLAMGMGKKVTFWLPMVLAVDGAPHALFIDPRRSHGLGAAGRRFAFSMMHERIRNADEDFANVELGILQFGAPNKENGGRRPELHIAATQPLYSLDELELMVASTYRIWQEVLEEREADMRRKAVRGGPLGV